jgi:hypothetical protein
VGFNFPRPPSSLVFPQTAQDIANVVMGVLVLAFLVHGLWEWRRGRGVLALVLLVGGAISYLNEPIVDVLGLLWHPRPGQDVAITTLGPAPLWGLGIYTVFFGSGSYLLREAVLRGLSRRRLWLGMGAFFAVNLAVELPLISAGLYRYYGYRTPPMSVGGLPLYWLFLNAGAPLLAACILVAAPSFFSGWRVLRAALLPACAYATCALAGGWPIFTALHMPHLPRVWEWAAALLTIAIGFTLIDQLARWVQSRAVPVVATPASAPTSLTGARLRPEPCPESIST